MKFIFVDSFNIKWNGYTARHTSGISGSHSCPMYLAEGIAKNHDHCVEFVSVNNNMIEGTHLNVKYLNMDSLKTDECDYIIVSNVLTTFEILNKIRKFKKIIIITHNDLCNYENYLFKIDKNKILIAYNSPFAKTNILLCQPFLNDYESIDLYYSFDMNDLPLTTLENKPNQLCYFACIDRGYKMVVNILDKLDNYILYTNTYANQCKHLFFTNKKNINILDSSSKYSILETVSKSKYFVYPLINLDNNMIHYDTFAYVVLEALLLGCVVIAPKIKVYEDLYGDAVCYIDTSDIIPNNDLLYWKKSNHNFGYPILNRYVDMIHKLDEDDNLRNSYVQKGLLLREKFSNIKISNDFLSLLKNNDNTLKEHLTKLSNYTNGIGNNHVNYLKQLKIQGFEPKVIYDIGSCVLSWTKEAKKLWPNAQYILFDAFSPVEFLYDDYDYHIGVLSHTDNQVVKFYQSDEFPSGNSYYREIGCENGNFFPKDKYIEKITKKLDTIVKERNFPLPDFVKIDVQGAEVDIIEGGINTLKNATRMIVELQHTNYNEGALLSTISKPLIEDLLNFKCSAPLLHNNGPDGDYGFINPAKLEKTILTIFAGREACVNILCKYLRKALELKIIDEVHFWNNTKNTSDENYIKSISNLKRSSSTTSVYTQITPEITNNTFELDIRASNDIHIKIANSNTEYEIVLGGWKNTRSVIRENNNEICSLMNDNIADNVYKHTYKINITNNILNVFKDKYFIFSQKIIDGFEIEHVFFKTGHGSVGELSYQTTANHGFYFMDTCEKSWKNYYTYYSNIEYEYEYSTILKCDDDIVFIDLQKLPKFIEFVKNSDYDLVFANTINNGVSAYFQQNTFKLIPKELMDLEYPKGGLCGSLWDSGKKAEKLHNYFMKNYLTFLDYDYNGQVIDITTRFSINFFGYKGKNWKKICDCYKDDEHNLTVKYLSHKNFKNVLYTDFFVSHLSFYKQFNELNYNDLIEKYNEFYSNILKTGRFN
jgi:FkbM family methyltransferase